MKKNCEACKKDFFRRKYEWIRKWESRKYCSKNCAIAVNKFIRTLDPSSKTKICPTCKIEKDKSKFSLDKSKTDGYKTQCKKCWNDYYKIHKIEIRRKSSKWYVDHKEEYLDSGLEWKYRSRYGISTQDKRDKIQQQENKCAICGKFLEGFSKSYVDHNHNHKTGKIREILCNFCNHGLGNFQDDSILLQKAIDYLNHHNSS